MEIFASYLLDTPYKPQFPIFTEDMKKVSFSSSSTPLDIFIVFKMKIKFTTKGWPGSLWFHVIYFRSVRIGS